MIIEDTHSTDILYDIQTKPGLARF